MKFTHKTAVITGGATGIGFATAKKFAEQGAAVCIFGRRKDKGHEAVTSLRTLGAEALFIQADVSNETDIEQALAETIRHFGHIDILVNNAAYAQSTLLLDSNTQQWKNIFETIAYGTYYATKVVAKHMIERNIEGSIINVSSINAYRALPYSSHYNSGKGAMDQLTRCAAVEFAEHGIRVNGVNPGFIDTPMSIVDGENELETEWFQDIYIKRRKIAQARAGTPDEVAAVIAFLASADASYLCGVTIPVDGGLSITF